MLRPILFNAEMVRAILEGRKTTTRRLMKPEEAWACENHEDLHSRIQKGDVLWVRETWAFWPCVTCHSECECCEIAPDKPDQMETADGLTDGCFLYRADGETPVFSTGHNWRPSIHMPKQAARIFLRVNEVYPQRLKESFRERPSPIREYMAEGIRAKECTGCLARFLFAPCERQREKRCINELNAENAFRKIWDSTIPMVEWPKTGWTADPWVWVIRFERCERPDGWPE